LLSEWLARNHVNLFRVNDICNFCSVSKLSSAYVNTKTSLSAKRQWTFPAIRYRRQTFFLSFAIWSRAAKPVTRRLFSFKMQRTMCWWLDRRHSTTTPSVTLHGPLWLRVVFENSTERLAVVYLGEHFFTLPSNPCRDGWTRFCLWHENRKTVSNRSGWDGDDDVLNAVLTHFNTKSVCLSNTKTRRSQRNV